MERLTDRHCDSVSSLRLYTFITDKGSQRLPKSLEIVNLLASVIEP